MFRLVDIIWKRIYLSCRFPISETNEVYFFLLFKTDEIYGCVLSTAEKRKSLELKIMRHIIIVETNVEKCQFCHLSLFITKCVIWNLFRNFSYISGNGIEWEAKAFYIYAEYIFRAAWNSFDYHIIPTRWYNSHAIFKLGSLQNFQFFFVFVVTQSQIGTLFIVEWLLFTSLRTAENPLTL